MDKVKDFFGSLMLRELFKGMALTGKYMFARKIPDARILLDGLDFPLGLRNALLSFVIPGFVFRAFGYQLVGKIAMMGCGLGSLIFFVWLGSHAANLSFALILSLHVTSISFLLVRMQPGLSFTFRILTTLCLFLALTSVYGFFQRKFSEVFIPMRIGSNVVVVKAAPARNIHRGEWIAHRIGTGSQLFQNASFHGAIQIRNGYGLDRVVAGPGDVVRFRPEDFQVNDQTFPRGNHMPTNGEIVVSEKQWFAWPQFALQNNNIPEVEISNVMLAYSIISEEQFVGKPFKRWFGRRQILP